MKCRVDSCIKDAKNGGMCWGHYSSQRRHGDPLHTTPIKSNSRRFFALFDKTNEEQCWNWKGGFMQSGLAYGRLYFEGKPQLAHRISWQIHKGAIPENMCVLHKCDNPKCVNPSHLYLGDHKDNAQDRESRNRRKILKGEEVLNSKLTPNEVLQIRNSKGSCSNLANEYKVSRSLISLIKLKRVWQHVGV